MRKAILAVALSALFGAAVAQPRDGAEGEQPPAATAPAAPVERRSPPVVVEERDPPDAAAAPTRAARPVAPPSDVAALNPLAALDKEQLSGFRGMPLFTPSRRRPEPPDVVEAPSAPPPPPPQRRAPSPAPELKLSGVVEGPDGAVAIVQNGAATERLRLGDQVDGWLVTSIGGSSLKLTYDEREELYRLFQRQEGAAKSAGKDADADEPE